MYDPVVPIERFRGKTQRRLCSHCAGEIANVGIHRCSVAVGVSDGRSLGSGYTRTSSLNVAMSNHNKHYVCIAHVYVYIYIYIYSVYIYIYIHTHHNTRMLYL